MTRLAESDQREKRARHGAEGGIERIETRGSDREAACRYEVGSCYWRADDGREYFFRAPTLVDGASLWDLVRRSSPLELNSAYCYLLLAGHFADTCVIAEHDAKPVGFVSAFVSPATKSVFVWQIAVAASERGRGLAQRLLQQLLARPACRNVRFLDATIAPSNEASRSLFRSLARELRVPASVTPGFAPELFPGGAHEREEFVRIGPLPRLLRGRALRKSIDRSNSEHALETVT